MNKSILTMIVGTGMILSSCNLPNENLSQSEMMTAAAMTVQAALATTPLASPPAASQEVAATPTTYSAPFLSVGDVTNCRTGPSKDYERITQVKPGEQVEIIGYFPPNYWVVNTQAGVCWIASEFSTPSGSYQTVATVTAPPTPQGNTPETPTFPKNGWTFFCYGGNQADITLQWNDKANNETGYRIYRNDDVAAELPANSTNYAETITLAAGQSVGYQIEAYNLIGSSRSTVATIECP